MDIFSPRDLLSKFLVFFAFFWVVFHLEGLSSEFAMSDKTTASWIFPSPKTNTNIYIPPFKTSKKTLIVIDAGHGGEDFGTHSLSGPSYQEKSLNLSTSLMLKEFLIKMGYEISLTRPKDVFISLEKRADLANELNPAIFVSVHYNSAPSRAAHGVEVYFYQSSEDQMRTRQSKLLASSILKYVLRNTSAKSRGVKHANFLVIRQTKMPAVLIEGGFLTNEEEMAKLKDATYIKKIAWGIAQGIDEYLTRSQRL